MAILEYTDFRKQAVDYLNSIGSSPVRSIDGLVQDLTVHFSDEILHDLVDEQQFGKKIIKALNYGYCGHSNGGINGIVDVRKADTVFLEKLSSFVSSKNGENFLREHFLSLNELVPVKVVAHIPSGKRPIGFIHKEKKEVYLLFCEEYKK